MILLTDICDTVADELARFYHVTAETTLAPFDPSVLVSVSPVAQTCEIETRETLRVESTTQAVFRSEEPAAVGGIMQVVGAVKAGFVGKIFAVQGRAVYCTGVTSSGTTALTSSDVVGGVLDSNAYRGAAVVQVPLLISFIHYEQKPDRPAENAGD